MLKKNGERRSHGSSEKVEKAETVESIQEAGQFGGPEKHRDE